MHYRNTYRMLAILIGAATSGGLLLAACGSDDDDPGGNTGTGTGTATGTATGAGGSPPTGGNGGVAPDAGSDAEPPTGCDAFQEGLNQGFMVDGESREFYLHLPTGAEQDGPWPVVFNWHGLGATASNMANLLKNHVNDASFPFILVTPDDTDIMIMGQLPVDWDVFQVTEPNKEARLFDEVLLCLEDRFGVDENHIHSAGFSLGSCVTNMLATLRGDQLASTATFSGGYWNNPANLDATISMVVSWPDFTTTNQFTQLFVHGGVPDTYDVGGMYTIHWDVYANNDSVFLGGRGHDSIVCDHGLGHTVPTGTLGGAQVVEFFADHPLGTTDSPYVNGLPADYPNYCDFHAGSD